MPSVSIIMPSYNSGKFISKSIESVLLQSFQDWELIIVDDMSSDGSADIILNYCRTDPRINLIRLHQNSGAAAARNFAIEAAKGRFVAFLDSDDLWHPNKLKKQHAFMIDNDVAFSYTAYEKIDEKGSIICEMGVKRKVCYSDILKTCSIGCLTAMYDTQKLGKVLMPVNTKREDFATWLNILKSLEYAYGLNEPLAQYRVYPSQVSAKKIKMAKETWLFYRQVEKLSFFRALYFFTHYAARGVLRSRFPKLAKRIGVLQ